MPNPADCPCLQDPGDAPEEPGRLQQAADLLPGVLYQFRVGPDGRANMPYAGRALMDVHGIAPDTVREDSRGLISRIHREDRARLRESLRHSARDLSLWDCEYRVCLPDQPDQPERWVRGRAMPKRCRDGGTLWSGYMYVSTDEVAARARERERESAFRLMFAAHPSPMWVFDAETLAIVLVNDTAVRIYGYTREEFLRMTLRDLRPPEDIPRLERTLDPARPARIPRTGTWRHRRRDGTLMLVEIRSQAMTYEGRRCEFVVVDDITERIAAETALRLSEKRLQMALAASGSGLWEWDLDTGLVYLSPGHWELTGHRPEEVRADRDFVRHLLHPKDRDATLARLDACILGLQPSVEAEYRIVTRDGRVIWVLGHAQAAERRDDGTARRLIGTMRDISSRKQINARLRDQHLMLQKMSRLAHVGAWTLGADQRALVCTDEVALIHGLPTDNRSTLIRVADLLALYPPEGRRRLMQVVRVAFVRRRSFDVDLSFTPAGGDMPRWVRVFGQPRVEDGRVTQVDGAIQDITVMRHNERELERLRDRLRELSARRETQLEDQRREIAMNLHDQLGPLLGAVKMRLEPMALPRVGPDLAVLREVTVMIDQALQMTREACWHLHPPALELGLASALNWLIHHATAGSGVQCQVRIDPAPGWLDARQAREIYGIAEQGIGNAMLHARAGTIGVTLATGTRRLMLEIRDDGCGFDIAEARAKRHFGLFGMQERALRLGASFRVESQPGRGTRLRLMLTRDQKDARA
ncbi:MAG: hypothetical protein RL456_1337 [Pseudomonadota bacterium]